jgi:hypothetical protein
MTFKKSYLAALLCCAVLVTGIAFAGDEAPAAKPSVEATPADKPATATPSPIHSMMKWVASQVVPDLECGCPSTEAGAKGWTAWFNGGKDVPLATLRDAMVVDGWNAERTVGFFKQMAASKSCSDCKDCDGKDCAGCDKGTAGDATGAADAKEGGKCCGKKCSGCDKDKADATGAADAKEGGGCCKKGKGCDKDKAATAK